MEIPWQNRKSRFAFVREYPRPFWLLVGVSFVDKLGKGLLYPFFALYVASRFHVNMSTIGELFALRFLVGLVGSTTGGVLTDRLGRRGLVIWGLVCSSCISIFYGVAGTVQQFFGVVVLAGIFADVGGPAQQAIVADLLPDEKRAQGYSIIRAATGLSVTLGPAIGGLLASRSYLMLFLCDAVLGFVTASAVYRYFPETKNGTVSNSHREPIPAILRGYLSVLHDLSFLGYCGLCLLVYLVCMNFSTTLGIYLNKFHGVSEAGFGMIMSVTAALDVLFQISIIRRVSRHAPHLMMALGTMLCSIGFALYGVVTGYPLFLVSAMIITIGEMIIVPLGQSMASNMAPDNMRGWYLALFGIACDIPFAVGPYLAGLIMDRVDPRWLWWITGSIGLVATCLFLRKYLASKFVSEVCSSPSIRATQWGEFR